MSPQSPQSPSGAWRLARRQHGVLTRRQLLELGFGPDAIKHRVAGGRLHPISRGVYAVGRPQLTGHGYWMAAVLSCGDRAVLSHESAAALWGVRPPASRMVEVSVPARVSRRRSGVVVHRRSNLSPADLTRCDGIPVTTAVCTIVDIAARLDRRELEAAINAADRHELVDPERLRRELDAMPRRPGVAIVRDTIDRRTFALTDSELERRFLLLARMAGFGSPSTGVLSTASRSTSAGRGSAWWSRRTGCATTAHPRNRRPTASATRPTQRPGSRPCGSPMPRSASTRATYGRRSPQSHAGCAPLGRRTRFAEAFGGPGTPKPLSQMSERGAGAGR